MSFLSSRPSLLSPPPLPSSLLSTLGSKISPLVSVFFASSSSRAPARRRRLREDSSKNLLLLLFVQAMIVDSSPLSRSSFSSVAASRPCLSACVAAFPRPFLGIRSLSRALRAPSTGSVAETRIAKCRVRRAIFEPSSSSMRTMMPCPRGRFFSRASSATNPSSDIVVCLPPFGLVVVFSSAHSSSESLLPFVFRYAVSKESAR